MIFIDSLFVNGGNGNIKIKNLKFDNESNILFIFLINQ